MKHIFKDAEEKLKILAYMVEQSTEGMALADLKGNVIFSNMAWCKMHGYENPEDYSGKSLEIFHNKEQLENDVIPFNKKVKAQGTYSGEVGHITKQGKIFPTLMTTTFLKDSQGNPFALAGIVKDISECIIAEETLRESEQKLFHAVQGNSIPTFIIDTDHIITHWNTACEKLTGFSAAEMVGTKKQWMICYDKERPVLADFIVDGAPGEVIDRYYRRKQYKSILVEGAYESEQFFPNFGEKGKWLFFTAAPLGDANENITGAIETLQDITDRKETEAQLRQAQKMESVGRLAGGVAHDYNNMLSVILGFTDMAMEELDPTGKVYAKLKEVLTAARRATDITRQLLTFARKQTISPIMLDLNKNVETTLKMLRRLIGEDIDLAWVPGDSLWHVKMDPSQVDQALANLCINARDAIEGVGKVILETGNRTFDTAYCAGHPDIVPGEFVLLSVSDTGCGMSKDIQDKIFEPFFTTKEVDKGTGLGLATVYGIVRQNNGFINVYSEPGNGTIFKIYLPRYEGKAAKIQKESTKEIPPGRGETILVVEDDSLILELVRNILEKAGYTVLIAGTPKEAISMIDNYTGKIHLLLTDVIMPEMNGGELARQLQSLYPDLNCVFMSGHTADVIAHRGVLDEGVHFVQKPFSRIELEKTIRKALDD